MSADTFDPALDALPRDGWSSMAMGRGETVKESRPDRSLVERTLVRQNGNIIVVESDDLIRELVKGWLSEAGYSVAIETSAPRASAIRAADSTPRLVIANVSSPRGAGSFIRSLQEAYEAPILLISARFRRGLGASRDAARRLRVRRVLPKPFTREELLAAVSAALFDK